MLEIRRTHNHAHQKTVISPVKREAVSESDEGEEECQRVDRGDTDDCVEGGMSSSSLYIQMRHIIIADDT